LRRPCLLSGAPVVVEAELRRALKDMKELPERQVEERENHGHCVDLGEENIVEPVHEARGNREEEPRDGDREKKNERQEVARELLHSESVEIASAAPEREKDADENEHRREDESVEDDLGGDRSKPIARDLQPEDEGEVALLRVGRRLEMNPTERQGKRDCGREHDSPEKKHVSGPTQVGSASDESLSDDVVPEERDEPEEVSRKSTRGEEELPSSPPVEPRRRTPEPHRVAVADAECC